MATDIGLDVSSLAGLVEDSADAIVVVDGSGAIRYANESVRDVFGYEQGELIGQPYALLIPDDVEAQHRAHHDRFMHEPAARPMGAGISLRARHRAGYDFDVAIALVPVRGPELLVAAFVREMSTMQRLIGRLAATNDILTASLAGESEAEVEQRAVELACRLLNATTSWLVLRPGGGRALEVAAECGDGTNRAVVDRMISDGLIDGVPTSTIIPGRDVPGASDSITELVVVPVRSQSVEGVLVAARSAMSPRFLPVDGDVAREFASAIAITLELIATNAQVEQLRSMADHDRIARDLHDTVIQRLFAIAMRLESAVSGSSGVAAERMGDAVDALDEVIREIRSTIFDLRRPHAAERGLRAAVAAEIDRVADLLGFTPSLRFVGPIDASVTEDAAGEAAAVVRELLSNVVRHADASVVDVTIRIDGRSMSVTVEDDGVGMSDTTDHGNGLPNLIARARALGGSFAVAPTTPHGVRAQWAVPLGTDG